MKMKWFISYIENGHSKVAEFHTREAMLTAAEIIRCAGGTILFVWSEVTHG